MKVIRLRFNVRIIVSQPMCAMEEYAIIFRVCVWFSPVIPPNITDRRPKVNNILVERWFDVK